MRFIHIADVHLGAVPDSNMPWGDMRKKEIWTSLANVITACNEHKADLLLIAGDLFHRQPLLRELKELNYIFSKLIATQVVIMAGNHDYIGPRSYYRDFQWNENVHMFLDETLQTMEFNDLNATVYGMSYHTRDITEKVYDDLKPGNKDRINILLAHGGDDKDIPINFKRLQNAGFDYVALGHIHKPDILSSRMAYSGSLEPLDKTDAGERGYIIGEITGDRTRATAIEFVPCAMRQYIRLELAATPDMTNLSLKDKAAEEIAARGRDNIYQITITGLRDESIRFDKEALLGLGNILEVEDETVPDYDFDALYRDNRDNMIGMFIEKIRGNQEQDEVTKKALYYGMEALLGARDA